MARRIGPYEVVRELGRGGMGVVFEVRDPALPRRLALKLILDKADPEALARFGREVELLARVRHPNVVAVHCVGRAPDGPYVVMDLIEGEPLSRQVGGLEPERAVELVRALCDAVGALHAQRILHRDLKPQNVIVRPDGAPVLLDFGLARSAGAQSLTQTGALVGTPRYMAPEQAEGKGAVALDERTDVYGLGAILFELLAGEPPFSDVDGGPWAVVLAVVQREPRWPGVERGVTPALQEVLRRAMAKRPGDRYATADELKRALGLALAGAARPSATRRRAPLLVAAAVSLLAGLGLALVALTGRSSSPQVNLRHAPAVAPEASSTEEQPAPPRDTAPTTLGPRLVLEHPDTDGPQQAARGYWVGPDRVVTAGGEELRLWDVSDATAPLARTSVTPWMGRSAVVVGDRLVCGGMSGVQDFACADLARRSEKVVAVEGFEDLEVFAVAFEARRGLVAYGYEEGGRAVHVSSPALEPVRHSLPAPPYVHDLVFSPTGDRLVCAAGGSRGEAAVLRVWSFGADGAPARDHDEPLVAPTVSLAYSPDGRELVGGTTAATVLRFTPEGRGTPHVLSERGWTTIGLDGGFPRLHSLTVFDVAFSPDGALLFTLGGDGESSTLRVFETRTWTCVAGPVATSRRAYRLDPEPGGRRLLVGRSGAVEVWDVPEGLGREPPSGR